MNARRFAALGLALLGGMAAVPAAAAATPGSAIARWALFEGNAHPPRAAGRCAARRRAAHGVHGTRWPGDPLLGLLRRRRHVALSVLPRPGRPLALCRALLRRRGGGLGRVRLRDLRPARAAHALAREPHLVRHGRRRAGRGAELPRRRPVLRGEPRGRDPHPVPGLGAGAGLQPALHRQPLPQPQRARPRPGLEDAATVGRGHAKRAARRVREGRGDPRRAAAPATSTSIPSRASSAGTRSLPSTPPTRSSTCATPSPASPPTGTCS